jgi:hypothetical protein
VLPRRDLALPLAVAGTVALLGAAGAAGWWLWPRPAPTVAPAALTAPAAPATPAARLEALPPLMGEAAILAHRAAEPWLLRFAEEAAVFVIDFPSLEMQGAALNRVAALVEKAGLPRDRVLTEAEMAEAIARTGDTPATYYYGHNYRGADLARFFRIAARDGVPLTPAEAWVESQLRLARALVPEGTEIAVLSIAAPGPQLDEAGRATILRHELGHGLFATRPALAAHIRRAWHERFTEAERAMLRAFLGREGYDTANEELMIDEAQAYLLHTPDARFFSAAHLGVGEAQLDRLRGLLRE